MIETTKLCILIPKIKNFGVHFLANFSVDLDEIRYVATTCQFVEAPAKFSLHKY